MRWQRKSRSSGRSFAFVNDRVRLGAQLAQAELTKYCEQINEPEVGTWRTGKPGGWAFVLTEARAQAGLGMGLFPDGPTAMAAGGSRLVPQQ